MIEFTYKDDAFGEKYTGSVVPLLEELKAANVQHIDFTYNGIGDSGEIEESSYDFGEATPTFEQEERVKQIIEELMDWAYAILGSFHPGWEINDGSEGTITVNIEEGHVTINHGERYTDINWDDTFVPLVGLLES